MWTILYLVFPGVFYRTPLPPSQCVWVGRGVLLKTGLSEWLSISEPEPVLVLNGYECACDKSTIWQISKIFI